MQAQENDQNMCMFSGCTELDLLPANCVHCHRLYCSKHIAISSHSCSGHSDKKAPTCPICQQVVPLLPGVSPDTAVSRHIDAGCQSTRSIASASRQNFCSFRDCTRNEIVLMLCERCGQSFCVEHRLPSQHRCAARSPPPAQQPKQSHLAMKGTGRGTEFAKLSMLKMKNSANAAIGLNKLSDESKTVVLRIFFSPELCLLPTYFAFPNTVSIGWVVDTVCRHYDLPNDNNRVAEEELRWQLFSLPTRSALPPSSPLLGLVMNNAMVMLAKGMQLPSVVEEELKNLK